MIHAQRAREVREAEAPLLAAGVPLMERAAFALAVVIRRELKSRILGTGRVAMRCEAVVRCDAVVQAADVPTGLVRSTGTSLAGARVALLVGAGNNGGDALFAGSYLARQGLLVTAYLCAPRVHLAGLAVLEAAGGSAISLQADTSADVNMADASSAVPGPRSTTAIPGAKAVHTDPPAGQPCQADRADQPVAQAYLSVADAAHVIAEADVVVDGLLGIGAEGPMRGLAADLVRRLTAILQARHSAGVGRADGSADVAGSAGVARSGGWASASRWPATGQRPEGSWPLRVAVDTPSGIGVDDGTVPGPVLAADITVTFGAVKPGLLLPPAANEAGRVQLVDMGLVFDGPPALLGLESSDLAGSWPVPGAHDHKYTRGVVGLVAGTSAYPGAAVLASRAAVAAGAGMVRYLGPSGVAQGVIAASPEVVCAQGRVQAWVCGPGLPAAGAADAGAGSSAVVDSAGAGAGAGGVAVCGAAGPGAGVLAGDVSGVDSAGAGVGAGGVAVCDAAGPGAGVLAGDVSDGDVFGVHVSVGHSDGQLERAMRVVEASQRAGSRLPVVLDAGALSLLEPGQGSACLVGMPEVAFDSLTVLTPHAGELATLLTRLTGQVVSRDQVEANPAFHARWACDVTGCTVLVKGACTVVAGPGLLLACPQAPAWLATAGSGDVLAGLVGTMLAADSQACVEDASRPALIAAQAALIHALAAQQVQHWRGGPGPLAASDLADALPQVIANLLESQPAG